MVQSGIINIEQSLYLVGEHFHIKYKNQIVQYFVVWKEDGTCQRFQPSLQGLYYCNMPSITGIVRKNYCLTVTNDLRHDAVNTVKENLNLFNHGQVLEVNSVRKS